MTVAELIEQLKKVDQNLPVVAYGQLGDDGGRVSPLPSDKIADLTWNSIVGYEIASLNDGGNDVRAVLLGTE